MAVLAWQKNRHGRQYLSEQARRMLTEKPPQPCLRPLCAQGRRHEWGVCFSQKDELPQRLCCHIRHSSSTGRKWSSPHRRRCIDAEHDDSLLWRSCGAQRSPPSPRCGQEEEKKDAHVSNASRCDSDSTDSNKTDALAHAPMWYTRAEPSLKEVLHRLWLDDFMTLVHEHERC